MELTNVPENSGGIHIISSLIQGPMFFSMVIYIVYNISSFTRVSTLYRVSMMHLY